MLNFLDKILLSKQVQVNFSYPKVIEVISQMEESLFRIKKVEVNKFKFLSNVSLGTAVLNGGMGLVEGIKVYAEIEKNNDLTTLINFKSKLRFELVFIFIFWLGVISFQVFGNESLPFWIYLILFPVTLLWFWFVYRVQEKSLLSKVEKEILKKFRS